MTDAVSWVGDHHVNGMQLDVPLDVLEAAALEPGTKVEWHADADGRLVGTPLEDGDQS